MRLHVDGVLEPVIQYVQIFEHWSMKYLISATHTLFNFKMLELKFLFLLLVVFSCGSFCAGSKILIYFLQGSYSQLHIYHPYGVKLAEAGHDVTLLIGQPFRKPHPKITYIIPENIYKKVKELESGLGTFFLEARETGLDIDRSFKLLPDGGLDMCRTLLSNDTMVELINKSVWDLVIVDALFNDCGIAIAYKSKAPHILMETCAVMPWEYDTFGVPSQNSWIPDIRKDFPHDMTFLQRVYNTLYTLEFYFLKREWNYIPKLDQVIKEKLMVQDMPSISELQRNASLVFVNTHFSSEVPRSLPPLFVQIGGIQCVDHESSQLPKNFDEFINKFSGFIYISFGTVCKLKEHTQQTFLETFSLKKFSQIGFIMKWDGEIPTADVIPPNVLLVSWTPQTELLAHPRIKGFVSHGGMLGSQEAVFYGVPVVGLAIFAEQDYNVECLRRLGAAIKLEIVGLTVTQLETAIDNLVNDKSYALAMKRLSQLHRDRPQHPLDTALYWTEYVLRHHANGNGLDHLKPLGIHQYWFQRRLLDVWAFITLVVLIAAYLILSVACKLIKCLWGIRERSSQANKVKMN